MRDVEISLHTPVEYVGKYGINSCGVVLNGDTLFEAKTNRMSVEIRYALVGGIYYYACGYEFLCGDFLGHLEPLFIKDHNRKTTTKKEMYDYVIGLISNDVSYYKNPNYEPAAREVIEMMRKQCFEDRQLILNFDL